MDGIEDRFRDVRKHMGQIDDDITQIKRRKVDADDFDAKIKALSEGVGAVARKFGNAEDDINMKISSIAAGQDEIRRALKGIHEAVEVLSSQYTRLRKEIDQEEKEPPPATSPSWLERVPGWAWALMGMGLLAVLQSGLQGMANLSRAGVF